MKNLSMKLPAIVSVSWLLQISYLIMQGLGTTLIYIAAMSICIQRRTKGDLKSNQIKELNSRRTASLASLKGCATINRSLANVEYSGLLPSRLLELQVTKT